MVHNQQVLLSFLDLIDWAGGEHRETAPGRHAGSADTTAPEEDSLTVPAGHFS